MAIVSAENQLIRVNLIPGYKSSPVVYLSQYDTGEGRPLKFKIYDGDLEYTIPNNVAVTLEGTKPDKIGFAYNTSKSGSTVTVNTYTNQMTAVVGLVAAQLVFTTTSGARAGSIPLIFNVVQAALGDNTIVSYSDIAAITEAQHSYSVMQAQLNAILQSSTVDDEVIAARVNFAAQTRGSLKVRLDDFLEYSVLGTVTDLT